MLLRSAEAVRQYEKNCSSAATVGDAGAGAVLLLPLLLLVALAPQPLMEAAPLTPWALLHDMVAQQKSRGLSSCFFRYYVVCAQVREK